MLFGLSVLAGGVSPGDSWALRTHERPGWMIGVGIGYGRGTLEGPSGSSREYRNGATPQIHLGRQLGQHFMLGVEYEAWMVEIGGVVQDTIGVKFRRSLQNFALGATLFPGNPHGPTGGIFMRVTVGTGWAGTAAIEVHEGVPQHNAPRLDEWGIGVSASAGYEFRIASHFAAGLGATFAGFDIGERVVDRGGFATLMTHLNVYF